MNILKPIFEEKLKEIKNITNTSNNGSDYNASASISKNIEIVKEYLKLFEDSGNYNFPYGCDFNVENFNDGYISIFVKFRKNANGNHNKDYEIFNIYANLNDSKLIKDILNVDTLIKIDNKLNDIIENQLYKIKTLEENIGSFSFSSPLPQTRATIGYFQLDEVQQRIRRVLKSNFSPSLTLNEEEKEFLNNFDSIAMLLEGEIITQEAFDNLYSQVKENEAVFEKINSVN